MTEQKDKIAGPVLAAENLDLWIEKRPVIELQRLELQAGTITALAGPNGSGKSTLLKALAGLLAPKKGKIIVNGRELYRGQRCDAEVRRQVTLVHQRPVVFDRSVVVNVAYGLRRRGMAKGEAMERALAGLEEAGLSGLARRRARELSGGERRRVCLLRALVLGPSVLLLDEPSAEVDDKSVKWLTRTLREALRASAVLLATHDADWAGELADRVVALPGGGGV